MSNFINNKIKDVSNMIDEQFRPTVQENFTVLQEVINKEMVAKGLDPLNKDDVKKFWASKGVESNG
jgi:hypothetical protein